MQLTRMHEMGGDAYYRRYEGNKNLGNTKPGDGVRFHGRGPLQLTGRWNYGACSRSLTGRESTLWDNPDLVSDNPQYSWGCSGWFWSFKSLNGYADRGDITGLGQLINGGSNGRQDRINYYNKAKQCLGIAR
jgi:putative chitinase